MGCMLTAWSAFCRQWTKSTVLTAKREVPRSVSFEARDMVGNRLWAAGCGG